MVAAAVVGAATVAGSMYSSKQAGKAAKTQAASADRASQIQQENFEQTRKDLMPYKQAGDTSLSQLMGQMTPDGYFNQTYTGQDIYSDPSYQFRLQQGQDAIQSSAAAKGGLPANSRLLPAGTNCEIRTLPSLSRISTQADCRKFNTRRP